MSSIVIDLKRQEVQPQLRQESAILALCWLAHRTMNIKAKTVEKDAFHHVPVRNKQRTKC